MNDPFTDLADRVAGDEPTVELRTPVSEGGSKDIYIRAEYVGGNPVLARVREVSVTIPVLGVDDDIDEYARIVTTVFAELRQLAALSSYEDVAPAQLAAAQASNRAGRAEAERGAVH